MVGAAAQTFGQFTSANNEQTLGQQYFMCIVLDNVVQSCPSIRQPIPSGEGVITVGSGGVDEANRLVNLLCYGALPLALEIAQSRTSGILYAGGTVSNQWESAYGSRGDMRAWRAGEWHHLGFTFSASSNFMRFYVDGILAPANNEGHYWPPAGDGAAFAIGGDLSASGNAAHYWIDECRVSGRVGEAEDIAGGVRRDCARCSA